MNQPNQRQAIWASLEQPWDLLIVGGGITGAGILREAARLGLKALLVEQRDFAWGTSSRSSKLVHGGLRYLKQGRLDLTRASVHERQQLLHDAPGLIDPLGFLLTVYQGDTPGRWTFELGLTVYDLLAMRWDHRYYSAADFRMLAPRISERALAGGFRFGDAQTDDARLVLRVLQEAVQDGGVALNYARVAGLVFDEQGAVCGARLVDLCAPDAGCVVHARAVVNATGAWADRLRSEVGGQRSIRPLRGSHLIFPAWRLPVAQALSFLHPFDGRPVFIFPWEGVTLVGTTDVDCHDCPDSEPAISPEETAYLMAAVHSQYPSLDIGLSDVLAAFAGVRPVLDTGKADPSAESREHIIWQENGLLTVTGGKLTTFRLIALDALNTLRSQLPEIPPLEAALPALDRVEATPAGAENLPERARRRLLGRFSALAGQVIAAAQPGELESISGVETLWAELRWAARAEAVIHLEDLLLRRTRLGLLLPQGGAALLPKIRQVCQAELGWSDERWQAEESEYINLWKRCYDLPAPATIPDWRERLAQLAGERQRMAQRRREELRRFRIIGLAAAAALLAVIALRKSRKK